MTEDDDISPLELARFQKLWSELDEETQDEILAMLKAIEHLPLNERAECLANLIYQLAEFEEKAGEPASKRPS
jgi:hypothetical protein